MFRKILQTGTKGEGDIVDLTPEIRRAAKESGINDGLIHLFVQHSTAALTTIEYEGGVLSDLKGALSRIAPADIPYAHDRAWGDGNGRSHVKAAIVGPSISIPLINGELGCGTWQQVVLLELDTRPSRTRSIVCTIFGD